MRSCAPWGGWARRASHAQTAPLSECPWRCSAAAVVVMVRVARWKSDLEAILLHARRGLRPPPPSFDRKSASRRSGGVRGGGARWRIRKGFLSSDHFEASPMLVERMDAAIAAIVGGGQVHWSSTIRIRLSPTRSGLHGEHPPCSNQALE